MSERLSDLQCVDASGHSVAWYLVSSSGRMFGVEEPYPHLAVGKTMLCYKTLNDCGQLMAMMTEFLTTLMIMRHIAAHDM